MEIFETEDQQVEAIKKCWKENYKSIMGGVILGVGLLYGGKAWMQQKNLHAEAASMLFESMMQELNKNKNNMTAADYGAQLLGQYIDTPYAVLAALGMAKIKLEEGDKVAASSHLRWALDNAERTDMQLIARMRLAQVLFSEDKADEALGLLTAVNPGTYTAVYEELKGDIYVKIGQPERARSAYTLSLAKMEQGSRARRYVQIKLDDLGELESPAEDS